MAAAPLASGPVPDGAAHAAFDYSKGCPPIAQILAAHWRAKTRLGGRRLSTTAPESTPEVLRAYQLIAGDEYCYIKMGFDGTTVKPVEEFTEHCFAGTGKQVMPRPIVYAQIFTRLVKARADKGLPPLQPFEFYVDADDGTRNNPELFRKLNVPIVSSARNPNDRYTLPLPDVHMMFGVYRKVLDFSVFPHVEDFANDMMKRYYGEYDKTPWAEKKNQVVFRGSCFPTLMSDNYHQSSRVNMRAELCMAHGKNKTYDIGVRPGFACNKYFPDKPMCEGCKGCFGRPSYGPEQQSKYKYQVIAEGIGAANDASVWKLLSNSANIRLRPDAWTTPMFDQWYDPMLAPYTHVIHSTVSGLPDAVGWCEAHPADCEKMAGNARAYMKCAINGTAVIDEYMTLIFEYMHDSVVSGTPTDAEWTYP
ncbi:MAG: hypothetical protein J3K34DRAFT_400952 [Monoraphidium minutum]|nr:MAG: hypothetical protein J3K34DRAFT_400952 [Monoraphidium minutum]